MISIRLKSWQICPLCGGRKSFYGNVCRRCNHTPGLRHGHNTREAKSPTYQSWAGMKSRCLNPHDDNFHNYGGRGISICKRWLKFENFLADMGKRPVGRTLDRFPDKNGNYERRNCRWATWKEQMNNTRRNKAK